MIAGRRRPLMAEIARKELEAKPIASNPDPGAKRQSYLTPEEVAERLRVTRVTVYAWLKMGKLAGERAGKGWRIRPEAIEAFVEQSTRPPVSDEELPYRLYSREEILEFLKDDELDPETVRRIEARLKVA
jgi:excisionase family DNA binding protein